MADARRPGALRRAVAGRICRAAHRGHPGDPRRGAACGARAPGARAEHGPGAPLARRILALGGTGRVRGGQGVRWPHRQGNRKTNARPGVVDPQRGAARRRAPTPGVRHRGRAARAYRAPGQNDARAVPGRYRPGAPHRRHGGHLPARPAAAQPRMADPRPGAARGAGPVRRLRCRLGLAQGDAPAGLARRRGLGSRARPEPAAAAGNRAARSGACRAGIQCHAEGFTPLSRNAGPCAGRRVARPAPAAHPPAPAPGKTA